MAFLRPHPQPVPALTCWFAFPTLDPFFSKTAPGCFLAHLAWGWAPGTSPGDGDRNTATASASRGAHRSPPGWWPPGGLALPRAPSPAHSNASPFALRLGLNSLWKSESLIVSFSGHWNSSPGGQGERHCKKPGGKARQDPFCSSPLLGCVAMPLAALDRARGMLGFSRKPAGQTSPAPNSASSPNRRISAPGAADKKAAVIKIPG